MLDNLIFGLTFLAVLGCGLIGGAFFAFSTAQGIAAMQSMKSFR